MPPDVFCVLNLKMLIVLFLSLACVFTLVYLTLLIHKHFLAT